LKIPSQIKIGTQLWTVAEVKRKHSSALAAGTYGETVYKDNTIVLDVELTGSAKRVTLFHEVLHAIRFTFGGSYFPPKGTPFEDWEHYFIGLYEEPILLVLKDNPDLLAWLLSNDA
jgi:hypothetical protein